jgi:hypothetical protein
MKRAVDYLAPSKDFHAFKSKKNSSIRTRIALLLCKLSLTNLTKRQRQKAVKKWNKTYKEFINCVPNVSKSVEESDLECKDNEYFYTPDFSEDLDLPPGTVPRLVSELEIVDDKDGKGAMMVTEDNEIIFLLFRRKDVLKETGKQAKFDLNAFARLQEKTHKPTERGSKAKGHSTTEQHTDYVCGSSPNQGGRGVHKNPFARENPQAATQIFNMCRRTEQLASHFLPTEVLAGLCRAKDHIEWITMTDEHGKSTFMYPAVASSLNYFSAAHKDLDFFFSTFIPLVEGIVEGNEGVYPLKMEPVHYFCFPRGWYCSCCAPR